MACTGTDAHVAAEDRGYVKAIGAEPDPARKLAIYARAVREIQARMAPLLLALRDASATEPDAAEVWREISDRREANMRKLAQDRRTETAGSYIVAIAMMRSPAARVDEGQGQNR